MDGLNLFILLILIALTAFFVAAEFSIIRVRASRINQLIEEGNKKALSAQKMISNLDEYLSTCQLGITVTALGIGWLGEPTLSHLINPIFEQFTYLNIHFRSYFIYCFLLDHYVSKRGCGRTGTKDGCDSKK